MAQWAATGRIIVDVSPLPGFSGSSSPLYVAMFTVQGAAGPNPPMQASYRPTVVTWRAPAALGASEQEAIRALRSAAADCALSRAIVSDVRQALQALQPRVRLSNEAQQEIEAFAYTVQEAQRDARFTTPKAVQDFIRNAARPARQLLELINADPAIAAHALDMAFMAGVPDGPLDASRQCARVNITAGTLQILAHAVTPRLTQRGRSLRATFEEAVTLTIMETWHRYFGEFPDFAEHSHFMGVAVPTLAFYRIYRADGAQFMREILHKSGKLIPLLTATN